MSGRPLPPVPRKGFMDSGLYEIPRSLNDSNISNLPTIDSRAIHVENVPEKYTDELLVLFFESQKHFGKDEDLEVIDVRHNTGAHEAIVTFKEASHAKHVLSVHKASPLEMNKVCIQIRPYVPQENHGTPSGGTVHYSDDAYDTMGETDAIIVEVCGFGEHVTDDTLQYYFENTRKSGGGEIQKFTINRQDGFALITFKDQSAARNVLKQQHKVESQMLYVKPYFVSKTELLFDGLPEDISDEVLQNFIEAKVKDCDVDNITFNHDKTKAMVQFKSTVDCRKVAEACTKYNLQGVHIQPTEVPVSSDVVVYGLPGDATNDAVQLYFENTKRSGGGDVLKIEENHEEGYIFVFFKDHSVAQRVCSKGGHRINGTDIQVAPYNRCLGIPFECQGASKACEHLLQLTLDDKFDCYKVQLMNGNESQRKILLSKLSACYAKIDWESKPPVVISTLTKGHSGYVKLTKEWETNVRTTINQILARFEVKEINFEEENWEQIKTELQNVTLSHPDDVALIIEKEKGRIMLVGVASCVDGAWHKVSSAVDKAASDVVKQKEKTSYVKELAPYKAQYLFASKFEDKVKSEYSNVSVVIDVKSGKVEITGSKNTVDECILKMFETLDTIQNREITVEVEQAELLNRKKAEACVSQRMRRKRLSDVWEVKEMSVELYADDQDDLDKMETVLINALAQVSIKLDKTLSKALHSDKWKDTVYRLKQKLDDCMVIRMNEKHKELIVFSLAQDEKEVSDVLHTFCEKTAEYKETMSVEAPVAVYMEDRMYKTISTEIDKLRDQNINIKWNINKNGTITLEGTSDSVKQAKKIFTEAKEKVISGSVTIKQRKIQVYFNTIKGKDCMTKVESTIPCVIDVMGSGFSKTVRPSRPSVFQDMKTVATISLSGGVQIRVEGGDITQLDVDVVVNAANKDLKHLGGLAVVIARKGGREIQTDSEKRVKEKGTLSDGDVYFGKAGHLKCKVVAHAVGPHWEGGNKGEDKVLMKTVHTCLKKTDERNYKSIAIPALCAGMFSYPVDLSCQDIVTAIDDYLKKESSKIKEVILCDISRSTVKAFTNALCGTFPQTKVLEKGEEVVEHSSKPPNKEMNWSEGSGGYSTGHIKVEVVKAELAKERTDVVVNSCSDDLQLEKGMLSKAILKASGDGLQQELNGNYPNGLDAGQVAITSPGHMHCRHIFHVAVKHFRHGGSVKSVRDLVMECLQQAESRGYKSISFPAIGTGGQKYPKADVAREMFSSVAKFSNTHSNSLLRYVRFVVYPKDIEVYNAFTNAEGDDDGFDSDTREGACGGSDGDAIGLRIGTLTVDIIEGDITEQDSDAIVASCNKDLDLSKGHVTKSIKKKGGPSIEKDCKDQKKTMRECGIAVTSAGRLKTKYVIFVDTKYESQKWQPVVLACLQKAEKHRLNSISFPALGTSLKCKPKDIAGVMHAAMLEFTQDKPQYLTHVNVVVFEGNMLPQFVDGMEGGHTPRPLSSDGQRRWNRNNTSGSKDKDSDRRRSRTKPSGPHDDDNENAFRITIYTEEKDGIQRAKTILKKTAENEWQEKNINDPEIRNLGKWQVEKLRDSARNHHVEISVNADKECVNLVGPAVNVADVAGKVQEMLRNVEKSKYIKESAELLASVVQWFYIKEQKQIAFPKKENRIIEQAYNNKESHVKLRLGGSEYEINFTSMQEWDVKQPNTKYAVLRRDLMKDVALETPKDWSKMQPSETVKLVQLSKGDPEFSNVETHFKKSLQRSATINKIERVQNPTLYTQYCAKKKQMNSNNKKGMKNERHLWHGTADYAVHSINAHGFNRSFCGKNATAIGQGVYFATDASYSDQSTYSPPDSSGMKRMYQCLVLTGESTQGNSSMRVPPPKNPAAPHVLYDSVSNPPGNSMFVIFNDTQAYPEHLITYK